MTTWILQKGPLSPQFVHADQKLISFFFLWKQQYTHIITSAAASVPWKPLEPPYAAITLGQPQHLTSLP
jgi:hypothetical protein